MSRGCDVLCVTSNRRVARDSCAYRELVGLSNGLFAAGSEVVDLSPNLCRDRMVSVDRLHYDWPTTKSFRTVSRWQSKGFR